MLKITITRTPTVRLFDRMPMPRGRVRSIGISRPRLVAIPMVGEFQRRVARIR